MAGRTRIGLGAAVVAIAAGAAPAPAAPTWLAPVTLGPSEAPRVALNERGDAVVAWVSHGVDGLDGRVMATFRPAGGTFEPAQTVSDPNHHGFAGGGPDVAIDGQGNAIAVWTLSDDDGGSNSRIQAAFRPVGGAFGLPQTIFAPGSDTGFLPSIDMASDSAGNAVVVWDRSDGTHIRIQAAFRAPGGVFEGTQTISEPGQDARGAQVAINAQGEAVASWGRFDGTRGHTQVAFRPPGGGFGSPQTISDPTEDGFTGGVAIASSGDALALWKGVGPCHPGPCTEHVRAAFRPAGGAFGSPVDISGAGAGCDCPEPTPGVGFDAQGNAVATWIQDPGSANSRAQASFRPAGGSFGGPQELGPAGSGQEGQRLAVNAEGDAIVVWPRAGQPLQAAFRPAGGTFGPATPASGTDIDAAQESVAVDSQGNGIAGWFASGSPIVKVAGFDAAGPRLDALEFPTNIAVHALTTFSVSPVDVWSGVTSTSWDFGDGGSAVGSRVAYTYDRLGGFTASVTAADTLGNATTLQRSVGVHPIDLLPHRAALRKVVVPKSIHLDKLLSRGLPVIVFNQAGGSKDDISLLAKPSDLRASAALKTIGRTVRLRQSAGKHKIRVRPTKKYRRKLALLNRKKLKLKVKIVVSATGLDRSSVTKTVTVKR
jgi:hypothetical protein